LAKKSSCILALISILSIADNGWRHLFLNKIAHIRPGLPFRSRIETQDLGEHAVIQARDLGADGCVQLDSAARVHSLPTSARDAFLRTGDILFQPRGTRFSVAMFDAPAEVSAVAAAPLWVLRADPNHVFPEFLLAVLMSGATQTILRQAAVGTYVPQVPRQAIEHLPIELPDLQTQIRLADFVRLERRERELMDRLHEARGRLFDLVVKEAAKKARKRANTSGLKPAPDGASTPKGPSSTPGEHEVI
jgi:hypothetical protein